MLLIHLCHGDVGWNFIDHLESVRGVVLHNARKRGRSSVVHPTYREVYVDVVESGHVADDWFVSQAYARSAAPRTRRLHVRYVDGFGLDCGRSRPSPALECVADRVG